MKKSLALSGGLFALVAGLTLVRPPELSNPQIEFNTPDGLAGQMLLNAQPSNNFCNEVGAPIALALKTACPACQVSPVRCLSSLSERQQKILSGNSADGFSVQMPAGIMLLQSVEPELAKGACEEVAKRGFGVCLGSAQEMTTPASLKTSATQSEDIAGLFSVLVLPLSVSLLVGLFIVLSKPFHGRWTVDHPGAGVQKMHTQLVPRVGGLALLAGGAAPLILPLLGWTHTPALVPSTLGKGELSVRSVLEVFVLAGLPAFLFGLVEDLTRRVGVRERLLATMASALLAWWFTGLLIQRLDLGGLDVFMGITAISLAFTAIAVGGVANAVNIIDGVHGLASGIGILALTTLAWLAWLVGDQTLVTVAVLLAGATAGFFILNYPMGRLFLGDGGAYLLGFWVAWMSVMLVARNPDVSPWACLLIVAYPVTEVLYSVRRRLVAKLPAGAPDREHLHSLVKVNWARVRFAKLTPELQNAIVAPGLWVLAAAPMTIALRYHESRGVLISAMVAFVMIYIFVHRRVGAIVPRSRLGTPSSAN